jgi:hypothetical protein
VGWWWCCLIGRNALFIQATEAYLRGDKKAAKALAAKGAWLAPYVTGRRLARVTRAGDEAYARLKSSLCLAFPRLCQVHRTF